MQPRLSRFFCCESLPPSSSELDSTTTDSATDTSTTSTSTTDPSAASQPMTSGPTRIPDPASICPLQHASLSCEEKRRPILLGPCQLSEGGGVPTLLKFFTIRLHFFNKATPISQPCLRPWCW